MIAQEHFGKDFMIKIFHLHLPTHALLPGHTTLHLSDLSLPLLLASTLGDVIEATKTNTVATGNSTQKVSVQ